MTKKKASKKKAVQPIARFPSFTWLGDESKDIYGLTFEPGKAQEVQDDAIAARLSRNPEFS